MSERAGSPLISSRATSKSVLVTGAAGFIGSHLAEACLAQGFDVVAVDSFTDYYERSIKVANAARIRDHSACTFIEGDLLELDLRALVAGAEIVFHLAAQPGVRASWGEGFDVYSRQNITALQRLLESARDLPLTRVVLASSSSVYGDAEAFPTPEDVMLRPVSPYGMTKAAGEHLAHVYWRNYDIPVVMLRYFTVYGPRQRPDMAFHRLIQASLRNEQFTVFGDGQQTRDFTYVADAVSGTIAAGMRGTNGRAYNIGGGSRLAMTEVFEAVSQLAGRPLDLLYGGTQRGDARDTSADVSRASADLGYRPSRSLREGLEEQFEWHRRSVGILV